MYSNPFSSVLLFHALNYDPDGEEQRRPAKAPAQRRKPWLLTLSKVLIRTVIWLWRAAIHRGPGTRTDGIRRTRRTPGTPGGHSRHAHENRPALRGWRRALRRRRLLASRAAGKNA